MWFALHSRLYCGYHANAHLHTTQDVVDGDLCETFLFLSTDQQNAIVRDVAQKFGMKHRDDPDVDHAADRRASRHSITRLEIIRILEGLRNQCS